VTVLLALPAGPPSSFAQSAELVAAGDESVVNFSFDQVEVRAFAKLVGDITGREFVVGDDVEGRVTIVAPRIKRSEVYPLFVSILESVGCSVIEGEKVSRIVSLGKRTTPAAPVYGADDVTPARGVITKILRLEHVSVRELQKAIESKVGGGKTGAVAAVEETNHLIVTDTADGVRRIEKIVAEIDQPGLAKTTEVIPLQFASAEALAQQLTMAMSETIGRGEALKRRLPAVVAGSGVGQGVTVVASPQSNSLILVGPMARIRELKRIIDLMDVDTQAGRGRLNAIFLKYMSAEEAATSISALLDKSAGKAPAGEGRRRISIEASVANNALLVDAMPGDFDVVKKLVDQLDRVPDQVLIEVMIAETSADDEFNLGVEMNAFGLPGPGGSSISGGSRLESGTDSLMARIQQGIMPRGLTVGVAPGTAAGTAAGAAGSVAVGAGTAGAASGVAVPVAINIDAVKRSGAFDIVSETSLEAQDNLEATVSIVNEIPILKSTIQGGSGTARDVVQNIDRVDVGIKLKITPHVIGGEQVRMTLNPSIEAVIDPGPSGTQFAPTIAKREVSTTVTVQDGHMIVIAGLTREDKTRVTSKVPLLGSIPLVGLLFRQTVDATKKTNMLIFVTPHIVTRPGDAEEMRRAWQEKTGLSGKRPEPDKR